MRGDVYVYILYACAQYIIIVPFVYKLKKKKKRYYEFIFMPIIEILSRGKKFFHFLIIRERWRLFTDIKMKKIK